MLPPEAPVVREFLRDSLVAHVASRSAASRPFVTPLWFTPHGGVLWVTTGYDTRLARNVARRPEVTLLGWGEARGCPGEALRLRARATRHAGLPPPDLDPGDGRCSSESRLGITLRPGRSRPSSAM
jgi:hypothetical protein